MFYEFPISKILFLSPSFLSLQSSFPYQNNLKCKFSMPLCLSVCGSVTTNNLWVYTNCFIVSFFLAVKHFSHSNCAVIYVSKSNVSWCCPFKRYIHVLFVVIFSFLGSIDIVDMEDGVVIYWNGIDEPISVLRWSNHMYGKYSLRNHSQY